MSELWTGSVTATPHEFRTLLLGAFVFVSDFELRISDLGQPYE
jgi:hypothetical protein